MRIAYPMRVDAHDKPGGDLLQVKAYVDAGMSCDLAGAQPYSGEIVTNPSADLSQFDIIHLTNLDRPIELWAYYLAARQAAKPIVFSTIHHSYGEIRRYEREGRGGAIGAVSGFLRFDQLELLRGFIRINKYPQLKGATWSVLRRGVRSTQNTILNGVDRIVVLTAKERRDICADFPQVTHSRFICLPNGYQPDRPDALGCAAQVRDIDICVVGRIEARKNQLMILSAVEQLNLSAVFIGKENRNHQAYCQTFRSRLARSSSAHLGNLSHSEVLGYLNRSRVHVSASWFEVSSLVDLEAACCGCEIVSSQCGGTSESLGPDIELVDPGSLSDLIRGIEVALSKSRNRQSGASDVSRRHVSSWHDVGRQLSILYQQVSKSASLSL
jgi:glycosyltransferase involved in cell wall biosynthesis